MGIKDEILATLDEAKAKATEALEQAGDQANESDTPPESPAASDRLHG